MNTTTIEPTPGGLTFTGEHLTEKAKEAARKFIVEKNWNLDALLNFKFVLDVEAVPMGGRIFNRGEELIRTLYLDSKVYSLDYSALRHLAMGESCFLYGFQFGSIPEAKTERLTYRCQYCHTHSSDHRCPSCGAGRNLINVAAPHLSPFVEAVREIDEKFK